ncbi:Uma2 family endonuclease [Nocardioides daeguensis]|uniref:Uma2 family endonuclease n=1 Tax=Nocardioides daeguensis TaxID=908359 RepID=A0ABP6W5J3_9ACTN|nr:Uma2 family endonuclease [Nocardioides daeguensis]MBV6727831.1 Uma2 family endonuclease [Nocardioides daeguensis]MCR1775302.1 Uma2 family endonuclease [Nocardioides daeguensis]
MSVVETLQVPGPWTIAERDQLPDDGHRYELVDGTLLVNAAPAPDHQEVGLRLWQLLDAGAPVELRVLTAPLDVVLADDTVVEPDVVVGRRADFTGKNLPAVPLLVVEVLSPSTQVIDRNMKLERYQRAGIPSYWIVDPEALRLVAHELVDGRYVEVADVSGPGSWTAERPFPVTITPAALLR